MNYDLVNEKIEKLGWGWNHPRIFNYINDLRRITGIEYSRSNLPQKHYEKLLLFLEIIERIDYMLDINGLPWDEIGPLIRKYSVRDKFGNPTNRLRLESWINLEREFDKIYCPF
ncbi:MAG: hypothetical protein AAF349_00355 [Cyanobacteria bacterium P01_A01_bin.68]